MIALHHGNTYLEDEDTLIMELQTYNNKESNPFAIVMFDKLHDVNQITDQPYDSKFQKFSLNLKDGTLKVDDYVETKNGTIDMPMWNPKYNGIKNCFTYLSHQFGASQVDENYSYPIYKYDSCLSKIVGTFDVPSTLTQEPHFVPNPDGTEEDDGLVLTHSYDFMKQQSKLTVLDAKDMSVLNEYALPFRTPQGFHSAYFP